MRSIRLLSNASPLDCPRRYSAFFTLICGTAILFSVLYTYSDQTWDDFQFPISRPVQILDLQSNPKSANLWSYVPQDNTTAWEWVASQRREGYRRPSWGGLKSQGAKGHIRENLLEGKQYLTTFPAAGCVSYPVLVVLREYTYSIGGAMKSWKHVIVRPALLSSQNVANVYSHSHRTEVKSYTHLVPLLAR